MSTVMTIESTRRSQRLGAALLVVLVIVMTVTVLALGYIARSDTELACGDNTLLRTQMDYLAESGLVHGRGLVLNPQDVDTEAMGYWAGAAAQRLVGGNDYYDVGVVQLGACNYQIVGTGYRQKGSEIIGQSRLTAELRLDPCVAFWAGRSTVIPAVMTINADVYCAGNLTNNGTVNGDAFAAGTIAGIFAGGKNEAVSTPPVGWPAVSVSDFCSAYYIGYTSYLVQTIDPNVRDIALGPSGTNPAGVRFADGDVKLAGNVDLYGTLVVNGNLSVSGTNNVIRAVKNFPALLVAGQVRLNQGSELELRGLAKVGEQLVVDPNATDFRLTVQGGLFVENGGIEVPAGSSGRITIAALPTAAALQTWPQVGVPARWTQTGGAFFKNITRN